MRRPVSLRARLARPALRWLVKRRGHRQSIEQARRQFRAMELLIPRPPSGVKTTAIDAGGVKADLIATQDSQPHRVLLYLHGGGYRVGAPSTYRHFTWRVAAAAQASAVVINYRLAPEHPFPAALDDATASYCWLLERAGESRRLTVMGDSAGGGLALALLLKLRDAGVGLPAAAIVLSPWTDLALTGASLAENARKDCMNNADDLPKFARDYLAGADPRNPHVSPLYGNPAGLPPTLIQASGDEMLRDDAVRMAERMRQAGCDVALEIWPGLPHTWQLMAPALPEARRAIEGMGSFLKQHWVRDGE